MVDCDADSAAVRFHPDGSSEPDNVTPAVKTAGDSAVISVLGLLPARRYTLSVAYGAGGSGVGNAMQFTTDTLPSDLPRYSASGTDPSPGYIVFSAGVYALAATLDRASWYRRRAECA